MTNYTDIKNSVVGLFLKIIVVGLIAFSIFGLLVQFIFSYLNQNENGPHLTFLNFAAPLFLTMFILLLGGHRMLFYHKATKYLRLPFLMVLFLAICFMTLMFWQVWYILTWHNIKANLTFVSQVTELLPMMTGLVMTILIATTIKIKNAS